jgi:hypothetical protein
MSLWDNLPAELQELIQAKANELRDADLKDWLQEFAQFDKYAIYPANSDEAFWADIWDMEPFGTPWYGVFQGWMFGETSDILWEVYNYNDDIPGRRGVTPERINNLMKNWMRNNMRQ